MPKRKKVKSKKRQNIGNRSVSEGIAYQCMATTSIILKMLLYNTYKSVKQNNFSYVDDISAKNSDDSNNYCQCKINGDLNNGGFSK